MRVMVLLCCAAGAMAQTPDSVVEGTVADAISGAPIGGASVAISGCGKFASAVTGTPGKFRAEGLPPCRYQVSARKVGYVGSDYNAPPELVSPGAAASVRLMPTADVEGRVFDEENRPVAGVNVYAVRVAASVHAVTDEGGRYVLEHLAPGDYTVDIRLPASIRKDTLKRDKKTGEVYGYPLLERSRQTVRAVAGVRAGGIDFPLRRVRLVDVRGFITDQATRLPLAGAGLVLSTAARATEEDTGGRRIADDKGAFRLEFVEPADYRLEIYRPGELLPYSVPLLVTRHGVADLAVAVPPNGAIAGVIVAPETFKWPSRNTVRLTSGGHGAREATVQPDGTFSFDAVPAGTWTIFTSIVPLMSRESEFYEAAWSCNGQPCERPRVRVVPQSTTRLEISLSNEYGTVAGNVEADRREDASGARLTFSPGQGGRTVEAWAKADGSFSQRRLPVGSYRVCAVAGQVGNPYGRCINPVPIEVRKDQVSNVTVKLSVP
jgi:hypothetical protein